MSPTGQPAVGALAVLVPPDHSAEVTDGRTFDDDPAYARGTSDEAGRLSFANAPSSFLLVVIHDTGCAQIDSKTVVDKAEIALTAWGRIEGRRYVGNKPGVGRKIIAWGSGGRGSTSEFDPHVPTADFVSYAIVDRLGNYQIDRMAPGEADVAPDDPQNWYWGNAMERPMHVVNVPPDGSATLDIGGRGRALIGRVVLPAPLSIRHDWAYWDCVLVPRTDDDPSPMPKELEQAPLTRQIAWWDAFNKTHAAQLQAAKQKRYEQNWARTYPFDMQSDGTFRIDDVEPGAYTISFHILTARGGPKPRIELAKGEADVIVGDDTSDEAVNLPPISAELVNDVRIGDVAPDFTVMGLDDRPLQLSKFRGKYVLLEFWATWCGPCVAEMDNVKAVYEKFGKDDRFAMISLSADDTPDLPSHFVAAHGLAWYQGFLNSEWDSPIEKLYRVKGIPSIWLIGPDGKVIKKNLRGEELMTEVSKGLAK